ncbi:MAG: 16S rRNA (guanine(527)-N(7))-methyltransferase RsmG [Phyllobacteriaceae bacterium]|nr:16S rRNA (guanine(527)-N(7))-methyltransferase RsmG [Phyllobacteriaceae bacterium]
MAARRDVAQNCGCSLACSRETEARFAAFETEFRKWAARINLVAPSTLPDLRNRHIADSAQILAYAGAVKTVIDMGSGGGFPGLILGIMLAETPGNQVHLIESNGKKCAFLRHVTRELALPVTVHMARIEDVLADLPQPDIITARALAPLPLLLGLAAPHMLAGVPGFFHKGREWREEVAAAHGHWRFDLLEHPSLIDAESVILQVRHLAPLAA